jgi:glutamyl-tRNA reductase
MKAKPHHHVVGSVLAQLRGKLNRLRERELAVALKRLPDLTPAERKTVEQLSRALMSRFMHEPSVRLRAAGANGRGSDVVDAARYLFALDDGGEATESSHSSDARAA